jgi:hypothetical protein
MRDDGDELLVGNVLGKIDGLFEGERDFTAVEELEGSELAVKLGTSEWLTVGDIDGP